MRSMTTMALAAGSFDGGLCKTQVHGRGDRIRVTVWAKVRDAGRWEEIERGDLKERGRRYLQRVEPVVAARWGRPVPSLMVTEAEQLVEGEVWLA